MRDLSKYVETLDFVPCNMCGNLDQTTMPVLSDRERFGLNLNTVMCRDCGLMFLNPRPTKELYNEFYKSDYRKAVSGSDSGSEKELQKQKVFMESYVLPKIIPMIRKDQIKTTLDIGCSYGGISLALKNAYSLERCQGIEPVIKIAKFAESRVGMKVETGLFEDFVPEKQYDLICFFRTLNHTLDPKGNLQKIWSLLKPDGYLLIALYDGVSNLIKRPFSRVAELTHPYIFCEETMDSMLRTVGFTVVLKEANTLHGKCLSKKDIPLINLAPMIFLAQKCQHASDTTNQQATNVDTTRLLERINCNVNFFKQHKRTIDYWNSAKFQVRIRIKLLRLKKKLHRAMRH